jgi:hypothetical protein
VPVQFVRKAKVVDHKAARLVLEDPIDARDGLHETISAHCAALKGSHHPGRLAPSRESRSPAPAWQAFARGVLAIVAAWCFERLDR